MNTKTSTKESDCLMWNILWRHWNICRICRISVWNKFVCKLSIIFRLFTLQYVSIFELYFHFVLFCLQVRFDSLHTKVSFVWKKINCSMRNHTDDWKNKKIQMCRSLNEMKGLPKMINKNLLGNIAKEREQ